MISEEKKQRLSELLKYIRGNDGVKKFAARLEIKLPTYSAWETARAFPSDEIWEIILPKLCELSSFTPEIIDRYLRGDYELTDLIEGSAQTGLLPRARPLMTIAKFRAWLQTLSLTQLIQILKDAVDRAGFLVSQQEDSEKILNLPTVDESKRSTDHPKKNLFGKNSQINLISTRSKEPAKLQVDLLDQEAVVSIIFQLSNNLSLEKIAQVDNRLRNLMFSKLQDLGLLEMSKYQHHPFYILMETYRMNNNLSYEQFAERLMREGLEAGLDPQRIAKIVRGDYLPNDLELIWIGVFIRKSDGSLYNHDELVALRDMTFSADSEKLPLETSVENHATHILSDHEDTDNDQFRNFDHNSVDDETILNEHNRNFKRNGK